MGEIAINSHIALNLHYKTHLNICCVVEQNITVVWLSKVNPQKVCTSQFMLIQENTSWKIFQTNFRIVYALPPSDTLKIRICSVLYNCIYMYLLEGLMED